MSRASSSMSSIFFWVIGSPICTAVAGEPSCSSSDENVAPWMPSLPMRPPAMTMRSPGFAFLSCDGWPLTFSGIRPMEPQ